MDHLAQDLTAALDESESCCTALDAPSSSKWSMRRRTRSAGNIQELLELYQGKYLCRSADNYSGESSSSVSELKTDKQRSKLSSMHQSDSDDFQKPPLFDDLSKVLYSKASMRYKRTHYGLLSHSIESDSVNEHSPASRPSIRRKRKFKRMSIDETPVAPNGKRKRGQRMDYPANGRQYRPVRIKPLHQSMVEKIEKFCQAGAVDEDSRMDTQDENCEVASESSISWSGGEGHEGDDELTDWAPPLDTPLDQSTWNEDFREIRAGCRRLRDERPGFSISTGANERIAKFLQDSSKVELRLRRQRGDREKFNQLASLYSLNLYDEYPGTTLLKKTNKTPYMQPTQGYDSGHSSHHKKIRTHKT